MSYVSTADINVYLGISWEDAFIGVINDSAESIFNNLIGSTWLATWAVTEKIQYPAYQDSNWLYQGQIFYLGKKNPTAISTVDGVSVTINTDYIIEGQKVFLKTPLSRISTFPYRNTIVYTAWYATIPADLKQAMYLLVGALYNSRKSQGIDSFRQDLISVTYSKDSEIQKLLDPKSYSILQSIIRKYSVPFIITTWADRTTL